MTFDPGTPPADADDHALASWLATVAGHRLLEVRAEGLEGRELKDAGDLAAHELLMGLLAEHRPGDSVLSEEALESATDKAPASTRAGSGSSTRSTAPASSPSRRATTGPSTWRCGRTATWSPAPSPSPRWARLRHRRSRPSYRRARRERPRIAVSRTRPPAFVEALAAEIGADLVPMGSAGVKVISVVRDVSDAYVHAGGQYEWDNAAPVAVARAAGLFCSRVDGSELRYNQDDVSLPDLIVCRPELAEQIVGFVRRHGTD